MHIFNNKDVSPSRKWLTNQKKMQTSNNHIESFSISSNLFPCVFVGMYGTRLSPSDYEESMQECYADDEHPFSYFTVDRDKWELEIIDRAGDFIDEHVVPILKKYGLDSIQVETIHSPKYYNFENDCMYFTVYMAEEWRTKMHEWLSKFRQEQKFSDYIHEHYHDHDGFWSFMPQNFDEIETFGDEQRCIGAYLTLCLLNEDAIDLQDEFMNETADWLYENSSTCSDKNVLDEYVGEVDGMKYQELYNNDYRVDELYHNLYEKQGRVWRGCDWLNSKVDNSITIYSKNEAMSMIFWAVQNGLTVSDLYELAA